MGPDSRVLLVRERLPEKSTKTGLPMLLPLPTSQDGWKGISPPQLPVSSYRGCCRSSSAGTGGMGWNGISLPRLPDARAGRARTLAARCIHEKRLSTREREKLLEEGVSPFLISYCSVPLSFYT
jgi:hypothetical protein